MAAQRLLAVDLGASGGKCFVGTFDRDRFTIDEIHRFAHEGVDFYIKDRNGTITQRTFWDHTFLYHNVIQGLHAFRRDVGDRLDGIGIDTWGADGQFVTADGDLVGKVYCYRDHRLDTMIDAVQQRIDPARVYELTGIHFQPFNVSGQLLWFMDHRADRLTEGCRFLPMPSIFYHDLGGVHAVDSTFASVTQLMDAHTGEWSPEMLEALGIPPAVMPEIVAPGAVVGRLLEPIAAAVGLNACPLVAVGSHDTASAFAAAPVRNADEALIISSGTWSLVGKLVPEPITTAAARAASLSNEGGIGNIRLLRNCMGTWLVQELRRGWARADGRETDWDELNRLTAAAPAFRTLIDPDCADFYNPPDMQAAIDAFCRQTGQPGPESRGMYLRTVYESLALSYSEIDAMLCRVAGRQSKVVNIVGGGCKNEMLNQFTANATGMPVVAGPDEATAAGNLMVQALGLGILGSMGDVQDYIGQAFPVKRYTPQDPVAWQEAADRFRRVRDRGSAAK